MMKGIRNATHFNPLCESLCSEKYCVPVQRCPLLIGAHYPELTRRVLLRCKGANGTHSKESAHRSLRTHPRAASRAAYTALHRRLAKVQGDAFVTFHAD